NKPNGNGHRRSPIRSHLFPHSSHHAPSPIVTPIGGTAGAVLSIQKIGRRNNEQCLKWPWRRFSDPFLGRKRSPPLAAPTPCQRSAQLRSLARTELAVRPSLQIPDAPPPSSPSNTALVSLRLARPFRPGSRSASIF